MARKRTLTRQASIASVAETINTLVDLASMKDIDTARYCAQHLMQVLGVEEKDLPIMETLKGL